MKDLMQLFENSKKIKHWKLWNFLTNLFAFAVRGDSAIDRGKNGAQKTPPNIPASGALRSKNPDGHN